VTCFSSKASRPIRRRVLSDQVARDLHAQMATKRYHRIAQNDQIGAAAEPFDDIVEPALPSSKCAAMVEAAGRRPRIP
jgi:hypothetical protein